MHSTNGPSLTYTVVLRFPLINGLYIWDHHTGCVVHCMSRVCTFILSRVMDAGLKQARVAGA